MSGIHILRVGGGIRYLTDGDMTVLDGVTAVAGAGETSVATRMWLLDDGQISWTLGGSATHWAFPERSTHGTDHWCKWDYLSGDNPAYSSNPALTGLRRSYPPTLGVWTQISAQTDPVALGFRLRASSNTDYYSGFMTLSLATDSGGSNIVMSKDVEWRMELQF